MKWRQQPARPVLAVSRAKHKANSQSLSEASNNEAYKYAFKINHCRGVARKTFRSGEEARSDRHKRPCRKAPSARRQRPPRQDRKSTSGRLDWCGVARPDRVRHSFPATAERDFAYLHFMRPKRPGRACFACLCQHSRQAETAAIGRTARRSVPTSNSTNQDAQGAKRTHKIRYVEVPTGFPTPLCEL